MRRFIGIGVTIGALFALTACNESAETATPRGDPTDPKPTPLGEPRPTNSSGPETLLLESADLAPGRYAITEVSPDNPGLDRFPATHRHLARRVGDERWHRAQADRSAWSSDTQRMDGRPRV